MSRCRVVPLLASVLLPACARAPAPPSTPVAPAPVAAAPAAPAAIDPGLQRALDEAVAGVDEPALRELFRDHWSWALETRPTFATEMGVHAYDDRIEDNSEIGRDRMRAQRRAFLDRARTLPQTGLSPRDAVTLTLFVEDLKADVDAEICEFEHWTVSPRSNPITRWNYLPRLHEVETPEQGRALIARYAAIATSIDNDRAALLDGAGRGLYANAESIRRVRTMFTDQLAQPFDKWPLMDPARAEHPSWPPGQLEQYRAELRRIVQQRIAPALEAYLEALTTSLLPHGREGDRIGVGVLPFGPACYATLVGSNTTLPTTATEVHRVGLAEIDRLDKEFVAVGRKALKTRTLAKTLARLRTDRALFFASDAEIEQAANAALSAAKAAVPRFFGTLPRTDCIVSRVPEYEAPFTTIAYYRQPHPDGSKPGEYFINVLKPEVRPRFEAKALAFHESIPGHHLQIALAQELPEIPAFRKHGGYTVFVEGWALYTERLAEEMGLYADDLDRLGMVSFDAWRASRLVVDTGIHAMGWTRERAEKFMLEHTALTPENITNEVDRYIVWPGQALAYKTGQLEIRKLRADAEKQLGKQFDLPSFHDAVLGGGAVSLPVLRQRVAEYVKARAGAARPG